LALLVVRPGPAELVEWFAVRALPVRAQPLPVQVQARELAPVRELPAEARAQQK
jgi:hypothetical protein